MSEGPVAQASSSEPSDSPTWNLLPTPEVTPLAADAPEPRAHGDVATRTLHLVSWPMALFALAATSGLVFMILWALTSSDGVETAKAITLVVIFLLTSGLLWYAVVFHPRLRLDAEGLRWKPIGPGRDEASMLWADIAELRLDGESTKLGTDLSLAVRLRGGDEQTDRPRHALPSEVADRRLALGQAGFGRVDRALRRYARCMYSSQRW